MNSVLALAKDPGEVACPSVMWGHAGRCQLCTRKQSPYQHHVCCHLDILAFGGVRNKAGCGWYFCIATLRDWQYLAGKMKGTFPQSLSSWGTVRKGSLGMRWDFESGKSACPVEASVFWEVSLMLCSHLWCGRAVRP